MLDGQVYELVMQGHHTSGSEYSSLPTPTTQDSSGLCRDHGGDLLHELICGCPRAERKDLLLRTPVASEAEGGAVAPEVAKANGQTLRLSGQMIDLVAPQQLPKLPTPTVSDQYTANLASTQQKPGSMHSVTLAQVFHKPELFPTPVASEGTKAPSQQTSATKSKTGQVWLSNVAKDLEPLLGTPRANAANSSSKQVELGAPKSRLEDQVHTDWGKFEPAIRRWETILDRPAPEPTKPDGKENNHRLSSKFTEWMMGLPDGWITDIGLKRNDELKACGNGVVPQQAELALSLLGINDILRGNNE
jgi:DNA (cytosine-5)-methyltransferase 1